MISLKKEEILHIAKLAKLELEEAEIEKYTKQLSKVVDYVSELATIETDKVEPTSQTTGLENIGREDEVNGEDSLTQDQVLSGTNSFYNGYFKVKAILEGRTDK